MKSKLLIIPMLFFVFSCKKDEDPTIQQRRNYINSHLSQENILSNSDSVFFNLFFDKIGSYDFLYNRFNIPLVFCENSTDSISVTYTKNPLIKDEAMTTAYFKSNVDLKFLAYTIYKLSSYTSGAGGVLGDKNVLGSNIKASEIFPLEIYNQTDLGYEDCLVCYFFVTKDNCTHTGFSRVYVQH